LRASGATRAATGTCRRAFCRRLIRSASQPNQGRIENEFGVSCCARSDYTWRWLCCLGSQERQKF
jgi:hypothetical protein